MKKLLLLGLSIFMAGGVLIGCGKTKSVNEQKIVYSDELSKVKEIRIESSSKIEVTASNDKDLKATLSGDVKFVGSIKGMDTTIASRIKDGILYISYGVNKKSKFPIKANSNKVSLVIDIPSSIKEKLHIKSEYTTINVKNSNFKNIECVSETGNIGISLRKIPNSLNIKTVSGSIKLNLPRNEKFSLSTTTKVENIKNNLSDNVDNSLDKSKISLTTQVGKIELSENK